MELLNSNINSHSKKINFKKDILKFLKFWPWILLSLFVFYFASYIYLRYTQPQYFTKTTLLFPQSNPNKTALNDLKNLGMGISGDEELQGEAAVIVSKPILEKVSRNLNLDVSFYAKGKIREIELYELSPYKGKILESKDYFSGATYYIDPIDLHTFRLSEGPLPSGNNVFRYGDIINLPWGKVIIDRNLSGYKAYRNFIVFKKNDGVVKSLENNVKAQVASGFLMELSLVGPTPRRSEDILNEIVRQYNIDGINDKNAEAENTQKFIDERLNLITGDLDRVERDKENFKKANQLTDLDIQANLAVTRLTGNVENIFNESAQLEIVNALYNKATSGKEQLFPTGLGLNETTEGLLSQYNELLLTKKRTQKQATDINPTIKAYDKQLNDLLFSIRNNLQEARAQLQRKIGQTNQEIGEDKSSINKYPTHEKVFRNIERQRNLKESIYLYLLQKREENAIALAVTTPKAKIVNPAYTSGIVQPNEKQVKTAALAIGLVVPLLIIFIISVLDTKIRTKDDVENIVPDVPVIAEIPFNKNDRPIIENNDFTIFAESFRILISNIKFILRSKQIYKGGVILITSSVKGEGKTTVSVNSAMSPAGSGKVLLIGADIRNPQLHKYIPNLGRGLTKGLTDYLVSEGDNIDNYIIKSEFSNNLDILFSGSKAPNPNDLLDMEKFDLLITELRKKYDYIILDSAPVMLVSDSLHLTDVADLVVYTVKSDFTDKEMIVFADNFRRDNAIHNLVFVLNNVKPEYARYGYKYGYGYYSDVSQRASFLSRFTKK